MLREGTSGWDGAVSARRRNTASSLSHASRGTEEIPPISLEVQEDRHLAIRLGPRRADESDARGDHSVTCCGEIINAQEETDPAGKLLANDRQLMLAIGACQQKAGAAACGPHNDPPLGPAVIRQRRNVLDESELEDIDEEVDRWLVLTHNQRNELEVRHQAR